MIGLIYIFLLYQFKISFLVTRFQSTICELIAFCVVYFNYNS